MRKAFTCLAIVGLIVMSGCLPNATMYYRPTVDVDSTHEKSHCVPIEKYVHFRINTAAQVLRVRGYGDSYSHSHAEGTEGQYVIYGNWKEIKYKNDDFYLAIPGSNDKIKPKKTYGERHNYEGYSMFNSGAVFPKQDSDSFDVVFPPLLVDGEEIELPILHVKRTIWAGISPFNC